MIRFLYSLTVATVVPLLSGATASRSPQYENAGHRQSRPPARAANPNAAPNDNRVAAGVRVGDTLYVRLTITAANWHILGDSAPAFTVAAFQEEGKAPTIPAPLIRVRVGTPIHVVIRNPLDDTLVVRGLSERGGASDSLVVLPRSTADARFVRRLAGTYQY
ncbi:MAG TPA: hypothetical protein VIM36_11625, partial [Gemmatimonadaceae bacterium]